MSLSSFYRAIVFCAFLATGVLNAQHLTISTSGDNGPTSGTNWSINTSTNELIVTGTGTTAHIHPDVITNHLGNAGQLFIILPWQGGTERNININSSISYGSSRTATLVFYSANHINIASGISIGSTNFPLHLALNTRYNVNYSVNSGMPDYGKTAFTNNTITTKGGHFWVGGGGTSSTLKQFSGTFWIGDDAAVTWVHGETGLQVSGTTITTDGGNVSMSGWGYPSSTGGNTSYGLTMSNSTINSGAGNITLTGQINGTYTNGIGLALWPDASGAVSLTTTSGNISLTGKGYDIGTVTAGGGWRNGLILEGGANSVTLSTQSGNITLDGQASFNYQVNDKEGLHIYSPTTDRIKIISRTGNITLKGSNTREGDGQYCNGIVFRASDVSNAIRIGHDGTNSYSGNILIQSNSILQNTNNAGSGSISVKSTGTLTVEPKDNAFTYLRAGASGTLTFDDDWAFGTTLSGFTFGRNHSTALDLSYTNTLTVAGPITFHTGNFTINNNMTSSTASDITINANANFNTSGTRQTITSTGGNIIIHADKDANGSGQLDLDYLTLNPGSGNIIIRGSTFNWTTNNSTDKPYLNGTGSITIEPSSASFGQEPYTTWFVFDQDGNGMSGLTIGKSGNTTNITHSGTAILVAGPINLYGGNITINQNLTSSTSGSDMLIYASADIVLSTGRTITTNAGDVILWANSDGGTSNGGVFLDAASSITTSGGHVWIGGSSTNGGSTTWNGLTVGNGYAVSGRDLTPFQNEGTAIDWDAGVLLDETNINSGGGNIYIAGKRSVSPNNRGGAGIINYSGTSGTLINSGTGTITMLGETSVDVAGSDLGIMTGLHPTNYTGKLTIQSANTSNATAISITASTVTADAGLLVEDHTRILSTATSGGGGISMTLSSGTGSALQVGIGGNSGTLDLLSASGAIAVDGGSDAITVPVTVGTFKIGSISGDANVPSSTANVTLTSNTISLAGSVPIVTTGTLTIRPTAGSPFSSTFSTSVLNYTGITGLTIGHTANTAAVTVASTTSIAGPITIYGGSITVSSALTAAGNILLDADAGSFLTQNTKGVTISAAVTTTNNGNITILARGGSGSGYSETHGVQCTQTVEAGGTGTISITAYGGLSSNGVASSCHGINLDGSSAWIKSNGGNVTLSGYGGGAGTGSYSQGFAMANSAKVSAAGSGTINITGTGGVNTVIGLRGIVLVSSSSIYTAGGTITLTGNNGTNGSDNSDGITIDNATVGSNSSGAITLTGYAGGGTGSEAISLSSSSTIGGTTHAGNILMQGNAFSIASAASILTTGQLTIEPTSNSFSAALSYPISNLTVASTITGLTLGKSTNTANITVSSAQTISGPITVYGGNIFTQQNLTSTSSGAAILLQASGYIDLSASKTIQTNGGSITLTATSGGTATGSSTAIYLNSGSQLLSSGGNITLGGGYAGTEGNLYAATNISGGGYAIILNSATVTAAGGHIKIYGRNVTSYGDGVYLSGVSITTTGSGTIGIYGDSYGGYNSTNYFGGITFNNLASTIQTVNGNITMKGILTNSQSSQGYGINFYRSPGSAGNTRHMQILSQTGNIQITGDRGSSIGQGIGHSSWGDIYFGSPLNNSYTASGNITFTYSGLVHAGSNGFKVKTTGAVTYEPVSTSFDAAQTFPPTTNYVVADGASGLTIGKSGNTANITFSTTPQSIAGPITVYGGTLTFNENLSSTAGGNISLYGNTLSFASGKTVSSTGELLVAPAAVSTTVGLAGATGTLQVTSTHLSTNFANGFSNITIGSDAQTGNITSNAFTLQDHMTFKTTGTLSLGGNITLGTNNATLGNALSMGTGTNYFLTNSTGVLKRSVGNAGTFAFPVGNSAYNPVSITNNTGSSDEFNLRVLDEVYERGTSGAIITTPRVKRTWLIGKTNANAGSGINFVFNWNTGESTSGLTAPRLYHHDGTRWNKQTGTTSSTSNSLTYTGYTGTFSPFAIGDDVVLLPVSWLHFDCGKQTSQGNELNWSTASEENSSRFVVERSQNGQTFEPIGFIPAAGYSHSIRQYRFTDPNPLKTRAYYRIAMEENNGHRVYTSICMSNGSADAENNPVKVYPNPSQGVVNIHATEGGTYQISDMAGRLVRAGKLDGITQIEGLKAGVYTLTIQSGDIRYTQKLMVE